MDLKSLVAESLDAAAESERQKQRAIELSTQVRRTIHNRAQAIADTLEYTTRIGGVPTKVLASWEDARGSHRIVMTFLGAVKSITDTPGRPSGRPTTAQELWRTPIEHIPALFHPLMEETSVSTGV